MNKNDYTKDSIKVRMLNRAAALWDVRNADSLDPLVRLLLESLASEIFKLAGELEDVEDRVVEKLARTFTPSFMMSASPAHAVLHARALSGTYDVAVNAEFAYRAAAFTKKHQLPKLAFTPVGAARLIDGDVAAIIAREKFYDVSPQGGKDHTANALRIDPSFNGAMWIGLELGSGVQNIDGLSFYFEFPLMDDTTEYFRLLRYAKFSHDGVPVTVAPGMPKQGSDAGQNIFGSYDPRRQMIEDIADKYQSRFISITGDINLKKETVPAQIAHLFDREFTDGRPELVWIKVAFPPAFDDNVIAQMCVHTNCFPVANIYDKSIVKTISPLSSIVPLEKSDKEYFLYMDSVTDSHNRQYKQIRDHGDGTAAGTYIIRRGGNERFNSINAKNYLERLLDLYRDEATAFSNVNKDVRKSIDKLLALLNEFAVKLQTYDDDIEQTSYLIFDTDITAKQNITASYNLTNGAIANGIKVYEGLSVPDTSDIVPTSAMLMTATRGGRRSPSESSQRDIYQYLLTSRDRVYTKDDVRLFCKSYFGEYFSEVEVESGYEVSNVPKEGIIKTTNVILHGTKNEIGSRNILCADMLAGLSRRSPEGVNYRIILR